VAGVPVVVCVLQIGKPRRASLWHVPSKRRAERLPWHTAFNAVPVYFISFVQPASILRRIYIYIYMYPTACKMYMNYRCYQIVLRVKQFTQIGSGAKCWLDIYHYGAGLAMTGRIRNIGQNVLQVYFQTGIEPAALTSTCSSLTHSWRRPYLKHNYTI
jgi:hypothetical protein